MMRLQMFVLICLTAVCSCAQAEWKKYAYSTMGTNIFIEVYHPQAHVREQAIAAVVREMERVNQQYSTYLDTSELSRLNQVAAARAANPEISLGGVKASQELFELLELSQKIAELTDGAFDVTYASVGYLYNYPNKQKPSDEQIASLLSAVNYKHIQLDAKNLSVTFLNKDVKIDLGGIAKGFAVDNAINILQGIGIENALVTAGGDTRLLGDRLGKPWIVGIRDPRNTDKQAVLIPLAESAMSTSGDYERYFEEDGVRFHHILSPKTGKSTYDVQSVSIIGPQSVYNDALSTAVFVMGLEKGIGLINGLPEFEAIVMDNNRRMHYSDGLGQ